MEEPVSSELADMAISACWAMFASCCELDCYHGALSEVVDVLRQCEHWDEECEEDWGALQDFAGVAKEDRS